ncbi:MAG: hypothetical protein ACLQQ4_11670 [Bacteroidia bacterium]
MKNKIEIIIAVLLLCNVECFAQRAKASESKLLAIHKSDIQNSPYIVEGKVIKQECFYGKKGWGILTCNVIQISKIYKGSPNIQLGTIKVITDQGGQIGNEIQQVNDGGPFLYTGTTYIIFCKDADSGMTHQLQTDNLPTLMPIDEPVIYKTAGTLKWDMTWYKLNDLYTFFSENGVTVSPADSTKY